METLKELRRQARKYGVVSLLTIGGNAKIVKGDRKGKYLTAIQHLAPADLSGYNVCPFASEGCKAACLNSAGRGRFDSVQIPRINRTKLFFKHRELYKKLLYKEIESFLAKCKKQKVKPAIRLNGTSDIVWEKVFPDMHSKFSSVMFYDYTKIPSRFRKRWKLPSNYYLLFSRSESNDRAVKKVLKQGGNVAAVFNRLPKEYKGHKVINGDNTDLRFNDGQGVIVGLSAKGEAKKDKSGFVVKL